MRRTRSLALVCALTAAGAGATESAASAQTPAPCSASFHVLHDDHIGALPVPSGMYQLRTNGLTCAQASSLFAEFLQDYNGKLPKGWRYNGENTFTRGTSGTSFTFTPQAGGTAAVPGAGAEGGGSHGDLACPGAFRVLHDDRIGRLSLPRGQYCVTLLGGTLSCAQADVLFARFLEDRDGRLGGGWRVLPASGEFLRTSTNDGFRVKSLYR